MRTIKEFIPYESMGVGPEESKEDEWWVEMMIAFAKYHVKEALKKASEEAKIIDDPNSYTGNTGSEYPPDKIIDKDSILNAYDLNNIK